MEAKSNFLAATVLVGEPLLQPESLHVPVSYWLTFLTHCHPNPSLLTTLSPVFVIRSLEESGCFVKRETEAQTD